MQGFPSIAKYLIKITRSTSWISITCDLSHNKKKVVWGRRHQFQSWSHHHIIQWSYDLCVTSCRSTYWYLPWIYLMMPLLPSLCLPCWLWCNMERLTLFFYFITCWIWWISMTSNAIYTMSLNYWIWCISDNYDLNIEYLWRWTHLQVMFNL